LHSAYFDDCDPFPHSLPKSAGEVTIEAAHQGSSY
jgi:hypothetical protein